MKELLCLLFVSISCCRFAFATSDTARFRFGGLPSAFYTKETRLGFGGIGYTYFNVGNGSRRSGTQSYLFYTLNRQFTFENDYRVLLDSNEYLTTGSLDFSRFPEYFYGITNHSKEGERVMISFDLIRITNKTLRQIRNRLYCGLYFQYQHLYNQDVTLMRHVTMNSGLIPGGMGYTASGIGPILIYDKRDNPLNPASGGYLETSLQHFGKLSGSEYTFTSFILDLRKYNTLFKKLIWNANVYAHFNDGEVPYRMMATIGGPRFLRGYYRGRFRENNMMILQHEFRMPVYKRIGIASFAGLGSVAGSFRSFAKNVVHYNYGFGLRLKINRKENTNLRIDYGITKDSKGIYVVFAEAF